MFPNMANKKTETPQLEFAEIAERKRKLLEEQAELDRQLADAKTSAFDKVMASVVEFNSAFGTAFALAEPKRATRTASGEGRKCRTCGGPPHRKVNCPGPKPVEASTEAQNAAA